jgi:hypothetical protein
MENKVPDDEIQGGFKAERQSCVGAQRASHRLECHSRNTERPDFFKGRAQDRAAQKVGLHLHQE